MSALGSMLDGILKERDQAKLLRVARNAGRHSLQLTILILSQTEGIVFILFFDQDGVSLLF